MRRECSADTSGSQEMRERDTTSIIIITLTIPGYFRIPCSSNYPNIDFLPIPLNPPHSAVGLWVSRIFKCALGGQMNREAGGVVVVEAATLSGKVSGTRAEGGNVISLIR